MFFRCQNYMLCRVRASARRHLEEAKKLQDGGMMPQASDQ
jgi:hypothetical protein